MLHALPISVLIVNPNNVPYHAVSPHSHYLDPLRPKHLPQHPILKHTQPSSSLNVRDQVSHPHKTRIKITFLYIFNLVFLGSKQEDRRFWKKWQQEQALPEFIYY
jgi:hypothetical protein